MSARLLTALVGGAALAGAFDPVHDGWLMPIAVALLLLAVRGLDPVRDPARALVPGFGFGLAFCSISFWWLRAVGWDAWALMAVAEALFFALLGLVDALLQRLRWWPVWTACAWCAVETVRSAWPLGGMPWGRLAYGTLDTPLAHALPYLGTTLTGFTVALTGGLLAWIAGERGRRLRALAGIAALGLVVLLAQVRPWHPHVVRTVVVAAVQGGIPGDGKLLDNYRQTTQAQTDATSRLARAVAVGARPRPAFVLWPENSTALDPITDQQANAAIWEAVHAIGVPIVVGGLPNAPDAHHVLNQGIVWNPVTGPGDRYTKHHPVPFGEYLPVHWLLGKHNLGDLRDISYDMVAGTGTEPLRVAGIPVADSICFDIAYDGVADGEVAHGAQLVTVQTSNATFVATDQLQQQFAITRVRALETGRYAVVAALNGISGVIAPDGDVLARTGRGERAVLDARVGLVTGETPAVRMGSRPGQVSCGITVATLALALISERRRRTTLADHQQSRDKDGPHA